MIHLPGVHDPAGCYTQLTDVAQSFGFSVEEAELQGSTNGDCTFALHRIRVEVTNTPAQRIIVLREMGKSITETARLAACSKSQVKLIWGKRNHASIQ